MLSLSDCVCVILRGLCVCMLDFASYLFVIMYVPLCACVSICPCVHVLDFVCYTSLSVCLYVHLWAGVYMRYILCYLPFCMYSMSIAMRVLICESVCSRACTFAILLCPFVSLWLCVFPLHINPKAHRVLR